MISERAKVVRSALEYVVRRPYEWGTNDCISMVYHVMDSVIADPVDFPAYRNADETLEQCIQRWITANGSIYETMVKLAHAHPLTSPQRVDSVRAGDIWVMERKAMPFGASMGVFDPALLPVCWTESSILCHPEKHPLIVWTYDG